MGYMKHLAIKISNMKPVKCECCGNQSLYVLEEEGVMYCGWCDFFGTVDDYNEKLYKMDDYIHNLQGREK